MCCPLERPSSHYETTLRNVRGRALVLLTVHQTRTLPLTSLPPVPIAKPIHQMTLATAAPTVVLRTRPINTAGIRSPLPPRSRRDDDLRHDGRSGYGRNRRESPPPGSIVGAATRPRRRYLASIANVNVSVLRFREGARDWDRSRDYDRRRDGSRDRYRDRLR